MIQDIIAGMIVAVTAGLVAYTAVVKRSKKSADNPCGSCTKCGPVKQDCSALAMLQTGISQKKRVH